MIFYVVENENRKENYKRQLKNIYGTLWYMLQKIGVTKRSE